MGLAVGGEGDWERVPVPVTVGSGDGVGDPVTVRVLGVARVRENVLEGDRESVWEVEEVSVGCGVSESVRVSEGLWV